MQRMMKIGIKLTSSAAAQIGMMFFRRGYANSGYTTSPERKVTGKERVGAGCAL